MKTQDILKRPIITEKSLVQASFGQYAFEVDPRANKYQVAQAIKDSFKVRPLAVRIINVKGKTKRSLRTNKKSTLGGWKKAIVTLPPETKIDVFEMGE